VPFYETFVLYCIVCVNAIQSYGCNTNKCRFILFDEATNNIEQYNCGRTLADVDGRRSLLGWRRGSCLEVSWRRRQTAESSCDTVDRWTRGSPCTSCTSTRPSRDSRCSPQQTKSPFVGKNLKTFCYISQYSAITVK